MALIEEIKEGEYSYPQVKSIDSYTSKKLKKRYFEKLKNIFWQNNFSTYNIFYIGNYNSDYYRRFSLFLTILDLSFLSDMSKSVNYILGNKITLSEFMEDDEVYNDFIELFVEEEFTKSIMTLIYSSLSTHNKNLIEAEIADSVYFYKLISFFHSTVLLDDLDYPKRFLEFFSDEIHLNQLKGNSITDISAELRLDYYKNYINEVKNYHGENTSLTVYKNIFYIKFIQNSKNDKAKQACYEYYTSEAFYASNFNLNLVFYIIDAHHKFDQNQLVNVLKSYSFNGIENFKTFIEKLDDSMPIEWSIEFNEFAERID